ncbi:MAG: S-methyl-5'-thioadenosine phosphorylase [Chloroflexi bacterium]|nr:S-methyl-5'-thioadenosine phosphorylase [Chloroflexota bacterium]
MLKPTSLKPASRDLADIGVFGGSGFYELLDRVEEVSVPTPYGSPSGAIGIGEIGNVRVAFMPRHGRDHQAPPHSINFRANIWAMAELGVTRILGPSAAGSLQPRIHPGDFVVCDQFVDRTSGRASTFFDGPNTVHISTADPYCPELRTLALEVCRELGITAHERGTVVVVQGPRFSTRAESRWYSSAGWEVINMTQYPEVALALEMEICYLNVSLITDYDVGLEDHPDHTPVTVEAVVRVFNENNRKVRTLIQELVPRIPRERTCSCSRALSEAVLV